MSIDVHTYIGHYPYRDLRGNTPKGLIIYMDRFRIERSAVANLSGIFYRDPQPANEKLAAAVRSHSERFTPFAVLNPTYPGWMDDLEACHELGMRGLRLYPQYHDYELSDPRLGKLLESAHRLNMPVAFTRWLEDARQASWLDKTQPLQFADLVPVVRDNPGTFLILNAFLYPMKDEYLRVFRDAQVYFDTVFATVTIKGWCGYDLLALVKELGPQRFLFGSGCPLRDPVSAQIRLELASALDTSTRDAIWDGNARRLLKI